MEGEYIARRDGSRDLYYIILTCLHRGNPASQASWVGIWTV